MPTSHGRSPAHALAIGPRIATRGRRARQLCIPVQYGLPGTVLVLKQANPETAWAVQVTTLIAWRDDATLSVDAAVAKIGQRWEEKYAAKASLNADETAALIAAAGLCASPPQSLSPEGWEAMLRAYGPLIVLGEDVTFPVRGQIVVGIVGDGQPNGTKLEVIDTAEGTRKTELLTAFAAPRRLVHWHADAGLGKGKHATVPPAGEPVVAPAPTDAAPPPAPAVNGAPALATSLSRRRARLAQATSTPDWDLPANFPTVIRDFWARQASRLYHYIWHRARTDWPNLNSTDMGAFNRLGFTAPTRLAGTRTRRADAGAGLDFLGMHREMIAATRQLAINEKLQYRPTGWSPIPWRHDDPDWPMPVWSGRDTPWFKGASMTATFRTQVREQFENATWLASVSLDVLGTTLEETIHNWMHMHWATEQPANIGFSDWLGSTSSSQVNPRFWKLHGWIDDTITRWESAKSGRSAAAEFAAIGGVWLGPVPRVRAAEVTSHDHGDITEEEAAQIMASIDLTDSLFPFANLTTDEMIAKIGPIGDVPQEFIAEARGSGGGDGSLMASLTARRSLVGFERHGARGMADPVGIGSAVFSALQTIATGGDFSFEATGAEYVHPTTPPQTLATRTTWDFELIASHTLNPNQHFWFELQYTWNGFDLRDIRVDVLRDKSSAMLKSTFSVKFAPVATSLPADPMAVVTYVITGRWDPVLMGDFSFAGELKVRADGSVSLQITRADENTVWHGALSNQRAIVVPTPTVNLVQETVFFSPAGSDKVTPTSERALLDWLDVQLADANHGPALKNGTLTIHLLGHASTTGTDTANRELSRKRAEKVERIIRDHVPTAKIEIRALGERESNTPDETEDEKQRYVRVWFEVLVWLR